MRILIIGFTKMKFMPYVNFYLPNIDIYTNDVHIVYWNRDLQDEDLSKYDGMTLHEFRVYQEDDVAKSSKIKSFIQYRRFVKQILKDYDFDKYIILHTLPGILLYDIFKKRTGRFVLDYRDSTYEWFPPFKYMVGKLVKWSEATFVSSDGFRQFLPQEQSFKTHTSHNFLQDSLIHTNDKRDFGISSDKIRLGFWGFIRHENINRQLIYRISTDKRFELHYYGREQNVAANLKTYVNQLGADNIFFHGEYKPEDRYQFILQTDCIHNLYFDNNTMLAMGNKYYDGVIFRIPQVCMTNSFMGKMCEAYNIGISLNPYEDSFLDQLYDYITGLEYDSFYNNCEKEINRILLEQNTSIEVIKNTFSNTSCRN